MQKIDLFIFDLDGTLIDSKRDIAGSIHYTMGQLGLPAISDEIIYRFVGNGVTPLIKQSVEAGGGHSFEKALKLFMAHYDRHLLDTTRPFPGILDLLGKLSGKRKVVLTNKSQKFSDKIIRGLKMDRHFDEIYGGDTPFPKKPDPALVMHLLKSFSLSPDRALIIGDSRVDIETGRNAGIHTCGVTWGFRPRKELEEIACDLLIERPSDLVKRFK